MPLDRSGRRALAKFLARDPPKQRKQYLNVPTHTTRFVKTGPENRAADLAKAQCTHGEIAATIAEEFGFTLDDAAALLEPIQEHLAKCMHAGRAAVRMRLYDAMSGKIKMPKDEMSMLMAWGKQHLGFSQTGLDRKVRKAIEEAEKRGPRKRGE